MHRTRPYDADLDDLIIDRSNDWSFSSNHASASSASAATFASDGLQRRAMPFLSMSLLIGCSRFFLETHYPSDVLGRALAGLCAAILVRHSYRKGSRLGRLATGVF